VPTLNDSRIKADPERYRAVPATPGFATSIAPPPVLPSHLLRSPVMLSSLPAITTTVDGITRQFYNPRGLPSRRISQSK
jgi:hypothetical protein